MYYKFAINSIEIAEIRSRNSDTLYISASVAVADREPRTVSRNLGDHGTGFIDPANIAIDDVEVGDHEIAVFSYLIVNNGRMSEDQALKTAESATKSLAQMGAQAAVGALVASEIGHKVGAAIGATIGTAVVPVIGSAIGALAGWLVGAVFDSTLPNCDGTVAVAVHPLLGSELADKLNHNIHVGRKDDHPGTDSSGGCGANSHYLVPWSVSLAHIWSGINNNWLNVGGVFPPGIKVSTVARTRGNLDLFVCGNDGRVYTSFWSEGRDWSGKGDHWRSLGGFFPPGATVAAVARSPNNIDLFICGHDGHVYTSWWFPGAQDWSSLLNNTWRSLGGSFPPGTSVSVVARTPNNLDLFVCGNDGRVYTSWWFTGAQDWFSLLPQKDWLSLGGSFPPRASVSAVARSGNNLDLYVCGHDGSVWTAWWFTNASNWSSLLAGGNWLSLGGVFPQGATISAVGRSSDNLDVFICGHDGRVYTSWWFTGARNWSSLLQGRWLSLGGLFPPGTEIAAVGRSPNNLDLAICGHDGSVYTSWWFTGPGGEWSGVQDNWKRIGGFFAVGARTSGLARSQRNLDLFICGNDGRVYTSWQIGL